MPGQTYSFQPCRRIKAAESRQRGIDVQQFHGLPNHPATSFLPGSHEEQRHAGADVVVGELAPEIVVILAGTNDIAENTGPTSIETIMGNIKSMAEIARSNQIKIIISSVLPAIDFPWSPGLDPSGKIMSLNQLIEGYCTGNGFVFLNYYSSMVDEKGGLKVPEFTSSDDLVHPNERGYKVMELSLIHI